MNNEFFKKKDFLIIAVILLISAGAWFINNFFSEKEGLVAQIYYQETLIYEISLTKAENSVFTLDENPNVTFEIYDGSIRFKESTCPDKICIRAGYLSQSGQMAVCLPNQMVLKIISDHDDPNAPDIISR